MRFNDVSGDYLLPEITCGGAALLDYDRDGDLDLYLLQGGALAVDEETGRAVLPTPTADAPRDRLYRNDLFLDEDGRPRLRFVDVTAAAAPPGRGYGCGVASGDFDNDGWPDLYVANVGPNQLLRNRGDGGFDDRTATGGADDPRWSAPVVWLDFDRDGWLDLYVGTYVEFEGTEQKVCRSSSGARDYCNPAAYPGQPDRLFRNRRDGTFEPRPLGRGSDAVASKSLGAVGGDFNGDGRPDLYVTNDGIANQLWIQQSDGSFEDEALLAGGALNRQGRAEASMGVEATDADGDGDLDLLMTHLVGETNTLYLNDGRGNFQDATVTTGLGPPSWSFTSWGLAWTDYDNDGLLDLAIANGAVRAIEELANRGESFPFHQPNQLFHNLGGGRYDDVSASAGAAWNRSEVSRALARGDLDNDGDTDLVLVNIDGPARVFLNSVGARSRWVGATLVAAQGDRELVGARGRLLRDDGAVLWRWSRTDGSFGAANDGRLLFGLGEKTAAPELRIYWPSGSVQRAGPLPVDRYLRFRKEEP